MATSDPANMVPYQYASSIHPELATKLEEQDHGQPTDQSSPPPPAPAPPLLMLIGITAASERAKAAVLSRMRCLLHDSPRALRTSLVRCCICSPVLSVACRNELGINIANGWMTAGSWCTEDRLRGAIALSDNEVQIASGATGRHCEVLSCNQYLTVSHKT